MGRSVRDMGLFMEDIHAAEPWRTDPTQVAMPWKPEGVSWRASADKPTIGVMWDDQVVLPHLPITRALKYAVEKIQRAGFTVLEYKPYNAQDAWDIIVRKRNLFFTPN
jgi:amidase